LTAAWPLPSPGCSHCAAWPAASRAKKAATCAAPAATRAQSRLDADARRRNLRDAFHVDAGIPLPPHVVLVDDVMTTGATLHAAAGVLHRAGVARVDAWVCARVA
jgi:predicted amidophosphoribosyltransferase